ncbi:MAG: FtsX-like permease family protein [Anaerolineales bacterium]|nr:FtsX-like permease family protein [Anaerolineales bacterium]
MRGLLTKVRFDLWGNKARTLQVVFVIAMGAIAIGLVVGGRNLIAGTISDEWQQAEPPAIKLGVSPFLTDEQIRTMKTIDGVHQVEGTLNSSVEWRFPGEEEWQTALLEGRKDFESQQMELINLISGEWPFRNEIGVIRTADELYGVAEGDTIEVRVNDRVRTLTISGTLKPQGPYPVVFVGQPIFYADRGTFERLTGRSTYDTVMTRDVEFSQESAELTDLAIQDYFERIGVDSFGVVFPFQNRIVPPDIPPAAELLNAIFLILGVIGVVIILLGVFLVYNSISAIISQQINQIGVMKAIGASPGQVFFGYFLLVLIYGLMAAVISVPLGGLGARSFQTLFIDLLNMDDPGFSIDMQAIVIQVAVAVLAPFLAALIPLRKGVLLTVREAISTYGLSGSLGTVPTFFSRLSRLPYTIVLIISNTFRNKKRVVLIELTLVLAGVVFMMVLGLQDASRYTYEDKLASIHTYDISLQLSSPSRWKRVESLAQSDPSVRQVESWLVMTGKGRPVSQDEEQVTDPRIRMIGLPSDSLMYLPEVVNGRWLQEGDQQTVVLSQSLAQKTGWVVGDTITIADSQGREQDWLVVGTVYDPIADTAVFSSLDTMQREMGSIGLVNVLSIRTGLTGLEQNQAVAFNLSRVLEDRNLDVLASGLFGAETTLEISQSAVSGFSLIFLLLAIMAVIIAIVGGVGLSGVLSLNVLERRREIGVMRSIGASSKRVIRLAVGEGVLLGWLSWVLALPLSIPATYLLATRGLSAALNQQLSYQFSLQGPLIWLSIITVLSIAASMLPARSAAGMRVRDSLSY